MQTNGLTERFNQTLSRCLTKIVNESQTDWDEKIDTVLLAYRSSQQSSTKYSPYFMLFQQRMRLPIDNEIMPIDQLRGDDTTSIDQEIDQLMDVRSKVFKSAELNILSAQKSQKETYDRKHEVQVLSEGTEILLENTYQKQRKGGKMEPLWLGPFRINRCLGKGLYELKNMNGEVMKKKANINRLKLYKRKQNISSTLPGNEPSVSNDSPLTTHIVDSCLQMDVPPVNNSLITNTTLTLIDKLESLLFDSSLMRLWRTGAFEELYMPEEDIDVDVSLYA